MAGVLSGGRVAARRVAPEWVALAASGLALGGAHAAQYAGLVPCALCLVERWPYRVVAVVAVLGLVWRAGRGPAVEDGGIEDGRAAAVGALVGLVLMLGLAAAAAAAWVHVGVEAHWWKSPLPECAAPVLRTGSIRDLLGSMPLRPSKPCDDPTYLVRGLPVSMAQMNLGLALAAAAGVAMCLGWTARTR